ncbi:MAG: type 1 periplasmic-binding domain-containing protein [Acidimicrobiales bacterium]
MTRWAIVVITVATGVLAAACAGGGPREPGGGQLNRSGPTTPTTAPGGPGARSFDPAVPNGGATAKGVTDTTITVAFHWNRSRCGAGLVERLTDLGFRPEDVVPAYVEWVNRHADDGTLMAGFPVHLWGRRIRAVEVGSGGADCPDRSRAAAIEAAVRDRAFAAVGSGASLDENDVAATLAQHSTMHFGSVGLPESFYSARDPWVWTPASTGTVMVSHLADYLVNGLAHGGPPGHDRYDGHRVYGLVSPDEPNTAAVVADFKRALAGRLRLAAEITYSPSVGQAAAQADAALAKLRGAGVNTVVLLTDPLAPVFFTRLAQRSGYHPDYVVSSFGFLDTPEAVAAFDQDQWANAFGVTDFGTEVQAGTRGHAARALDWYRAWNEVRPGQEPPDDARLWWNSLASLVWGVSASGPDLTPARVRAGLVSAVTFTGPGGESVAFSPTTHGGITDYALIAWERASPPTPHRPPGRYRFWERDPPLRHPG